MNAYFLLMNSKRCNCLNDFDSVSKYSHLTQFSVHILLYKLIEQFSIFRQIHNSHFINGHTQILENFFSLAHIMSHAFALS